MVAAGVPRLENRPDCIHFGAAGHVLGTGHTLRKQFTAYMLPPPRLVARTVKHNMRLWRAERRGRQIPTVARNSVAG